MSPSSCDNSFRMARHVTFRMASARFERSSAVSDRSANRNTSRSTMRRICRFRNNARSTACGSPSDGRESTSCCSYCSRRNPRCRSWPAAISTSQCGYRITASERNRLYEKMVSTDRSTARSAANWRAASGASEVSRLRKWIARSRSGNEGSRASTARSAGAGSRSSCISSRRLGTTFDYKRRRYNAVACTRRFRLRPQILLPSSLSPPGPPQCVSRWMNPL